MVFSLSGVLPIGDWRKKFDQEGSERQKSHRDRLHDRDRARDEPVPGQFGPQEALGGGGSTMDPSLGSLMLRAPTSIGSPGRQEG